MNLEALLRHMADPIFNPGGQEDIQDSRMLRWEEIGAALPPFNWDEGFRVEQQLQKRLSQPGFKLPIKNQGISGSCGGQETSQYVGVGEARFTGSFEERSAKDVIANTYILGAGGVMLGSTFRDNSSHAINRGVARESVCPSYDNGQPPTDAFMNRKQDINEAVIADEKLAKEKSYVYLPIDIDAVAQAIAANWGVGILLRGESNGTWYTPFPKPGKASWGHFMYMGDAFLLPGGKKNIRGPQSWGIGVGENGWQNFGEDWFASGRIVQIRAFVYDETIPLPPKYTFTRDLYVGKTGIDVRFLQAFLNAHGCPVATTGPGSAGQETSYFGEMTQMALAKYQRDHGISPALGYFGPITRAKVNAV